MCVCVCICVCSACEEVTDEEGGRCVCAQRGGGLTDTVFTSILIWINGVSQLALLVCDVLASYCISLYRNYLVLLFLMVKS